MGRTLKTISICAFLTAASVTFTACSFWGKSGEDEKTISKDYAYELSEESVSFTPDNNEKYVKNIVIVYFESGTSESEKQELVDEIGGKIVGRFDTLDQLQIEVETDGYEELIDICEKLNSRSNVMSAKPDKVSDINVDKVYTYPEDGYTDVWDADDPGGDNWGLEAVKAPAAWTGNDMRSPVKVGVVDSGFDSSHEDLVNIINKTEQPEGLSSDVMEHGTHVAGIIAAEAGNRKGVAGSSWNAELNCYGVGDNSASDSELMERILTAVKDGCKVINLSWGGSGSLTSSSSNKTEQSINEEGETASIFITKLLETGHDFIIVQAAGNGAADGYGVDAVNNGNFAAITRDNCYTGKYSYDEIMSHVIIVGSAGQTSDGFMQSVFSNGGENVSVCAPGENILSTVHGGYLSLNGTSMAAPFVTGAAATVWGEDPDMTADEVKKAVCGSSSVNAIDNPDSEYASGTFALLDIDSGLSAVSGETPAETTSPEKKASVKFDIVQHVTDSSGTAHFEYGMPIPGLEVDLYKIDIDDYKDLIIEASNSAVGGNDIVHAESNLIKEKGEKVNDWTFQDSPYELDLEPGHYVVLDDTAIGEEHHAAFTITDDLSIVPVYNSNKIVDGVYTNEIIFEKGEFNWDMVKDDTVYLLSSRWVVYVDANIVVSNSYNDNLADDTQIELYRKDGDTLYPVNVSKEEIQLYAASPFKAFIGDCYYPGTYVIKCTKAPAGYEPFDDITFSIGRNDYNFPLFKIEDSGNSKVEITSSDGVSEPYYSAQDADPAVIKIKIGSGNTSKAGNNYYDGQYCSFYYPEAWVGNVEFEEYETNISVHQKGHKEGWGWIYTLDFGQDSFYRDHGKQDEFYEKSGKLIWIVTPTDVQYEPDDADMYRKLMDQDLSVIKNSFVLK